MSNTIRNITDKRKLKYTLDSQVRIDQAKERMVFDDIHIWEGFDGLSDEEIIKCLALMSYCESKADALRWLRRYKEQEMLKDEKEYLERTAQRSGEIDNINKTLARMDNRIEEQDG